MTEASTTHTKQYFVYNPILPFHAPNQTPTYETIAAACQQLNANAAAIYSSGGNGQLGHLILTVGAASYLRVSGNIAFDPPANPGPPPPVAAAAAIRATHATSLRTYKTYHDTDSALKAQLIAAIDEKFIAALKHRVYAFQLRTTFELITHIKATYGSIPDNALVQNETNIKAVWDVSTPIENLFQQIETGCEFAEDAGEPYTEPQKVRFGLNLIHATGHFNDDCKSWRRRPVAERTWANFKTTFRLAHEDFLLDATVGGTGFANHIKDIFGAVEANLAQARREDTAKIDQLTDLVKSLQVQLSEKKNDGGAKEYPDRYKGPFEKRTYCHTHGFRVRPGHTSATCKSPGPDHKKDATAANRLGGNEAGMPKQK